MNRCVIFGGSGYIGSMLARGLAESGSFAEIVLADLKPLAGPLPPHTRFVPCDVRGPIAPHVVAADAAWIFNFATAHLAPGRTTQEYFDTNLYGARNVCAYAERIGCPNLFFGSSTAVYGPTASPAHEDATKYPATPFATSKVCAELIHEVWLKSAPGRRLIVVRPGPVYGPSAGGEIDSMIRGLRRHVLFLPGPDGARRSFGYIFGLLESFEFMLDRREPLLVYNYAEPESGTLGTLARRLGQFLGTRALVVPMPAPLARHLTPPSAWIEPAKLKQLGFQFRYDFTRALAHWRSLVPTDF
jgi:nucleoside-diphosphate-sugar epimerase